MTAKKKPRKPTKKKPKPKPDLISREKVLEYLRGYARRAHTSQRVATHDIAANHHGREWAAHEIADRIRRMP